MRALRLPIMLLLSLALAPTARAALIITVQPTHLVLAPGVAGTFLWHLVPPPGETIPNTAQGYFEGGSSESNMVGFLRIDPPSVNTIWAWPQPANCLPIVGTATNAAGQTLAVPLAAGLWRVNLGTIARGESAQVSVTVSGKPIGAGP